jgi:hypothetical protein
MTPKPDPHKAIYLKSNQRTVRRSRKRPSPLNQWQPHQSSTALDAWGTALRDMRAHGKSWE